MGEMPPSERGAGEAGAFACIADTVNKSFFWEVAAWDGY
jgi:hypothetical protein